MGGAAPGSLRPRRRGRGSELRRDVWHAQPTHQDGRSRCGGIDGRVPPPDITGRSTADHRRAAPCKPTSSCERRWSETRTRLVSLTRALTRAEGLRIRSGASHTFVSRLREVAVSGALDRTLGPMRAMLELLDEELDRIDRELTDGAHEDGEIARLMTVPGIGPITATAFVSAIDDVSRFHTGQPGDQLRGAGASRIQLGRTGHAGDGSSAVRNRASSACSSKRPGLSGGPKAPTAPRSVPGPTASRFAAGNASP